MFFGPQIGARVCDPQNCSGVLRPQSRGPFTRGKK